ncbi:hypothetical protein [Chitinasiproducens palmae]|uniref:PqqD family protein n=1 Tax=Chitinasiproducens palmae TaxID=1770053 RepID=A0A1H2PMP0_9BURK|nr:hypothetical protein [Chitinasiproducens palmae]SDV47380.1 hypothetical protein SAMN05216551_102531 [Chitinasiproducens palmae]
MEFRRPAGAADLASLFLSASLDCVPLGDELILYSETKDGYFGVSGAAADILTLVQRTRGKGWRRAELIDTLSAGRHLTEDEHMLLLEGISTLLELGALHEK